MLIQNLEARVRAMLDRIVERHSSRLPFGGTYLKAFRVHVLRTFATVRGQWEAFYESGDVHRLIDFLIDMARGNLPVPFYLAPFAGLFLESLRVWLHNNSDVIRGPVGEASPAA